VLGKYRDLRLRVIIPETYASNPRSATWPL
jgi:hypothetical protein